MKNFIKVMLIINLFFSFIVVNAFDNYDYSTNNKEKSILIEKYLIGHKKKIVNFTKQYDIKNDVEINKNLDKIDFLIDSLKKIQYNNIEKDREDLIINTILDEIKKVNDTLKVLLQNKKNQFENRFEEKKEKYTSLSKRLSLNLDKIVKSFNYLHKIDSYKLTGKEIEIKKSLKKINDLSTILKSFSRIKFENEQQIEDSFLKILLEIRKEMNIIKNNI